MGSLECFQTAASDWDRMRSQFFSEAVREKALSAAAVLEGQTAADGCESAKISIFVASGRKPPVG